MKEIEFIKMAGTGNDYIFIDCMEGMGPDLVPDDIAKLSNRKTGIGSDGLIKIIPSDKGIAKMKMWNSDGSSSRMCGNALRCIGLYIFKKFGERSFLLESDTGTHRTEILKNKGDYEAMVEVEIGRPFFQADQIPFLPDRAGVNISSEDTCISIPLHLENIPHVDSENLSGLRATLVSVGNPHCVIFVKDAHHFPVREVGSYIETHPSFPERTNVEFVTKKSDGTLFQRTYERGAGETDACGSGACAVLAASVLENRGPAKNSIELLGGILEVEWDRSADTIFLRGSAREIFRGSFSMASF